MSEYWDGKFGRVLRWRGPSEEPGVEVVMILGPVAYERVSYVVLDDTRREQDGGVWATGSYFARSEWECIAEPDEGVRGR